MRTSTNRRKSPRPASRTPRLLAIGAVVAMQAVAALYFLIDGVDDILLGVRTGIDWEVIMECLVAVALVIGVAIGAVHMARLISEAHRSHAALSVARGAMAELIDQRFAEWRLSSAESDIALFAPKGCSVAEIASMRAAATGTVRSQLSQIYAKAGVNSQTGLISLFIDDLLAIDPDAAK